MAAILSGGDESIWWSWWHLKGKLGQYSVMAEDYFAPFYLYALT